MRLVALAAITRWFVLEGRRLRIQGLSDVSGTTPVLHRLCRWRFALLVPLSSGFLERRGKRLPSARTGCCLLLPLFFALAGFAVLLRCVHHEATHS